MNRGMWLGFVFFVGLVILGFGTLLVGNIDLFGQPMFLEVHFPSGQGLREGDDVRVDGLIKGKVKSIDLSSKGGIVATLRIDHRIEIFRDGTVTVEAASVLGGSTVSIKRGTQTDRKLDLTLLPLAGNAAPGLDEVGKLAADNRDSLKQAIDNIRDITQALKDGPGTLPKLIKSPELHDKISATVDEAKTAVAEFKKVGENVNRITEKIEKGDGIVGTLLNDKTIPQKVHKALDDIQKISDNFSQIAEKVNRGDGTLAALINDKDMKDRLKKTVENVEATSDSLRVMSKKLENGEGSIGRLLQDDELYEKAKQTIADLDKMIARAARATVEIVGESRIYDDTQVNISKAGIRISPDESKFFEVGVAFLALDREGEILFKSLVEDDESSTEIVPEIQVGYRIPWFLDHRLTLRGGFIEGKPGGALDFRWDDWGLFTHPVRFSFEARDAYNDLDDEDIDEELSGAMIRAYAKFPLWNRRETWYETVLSSLHVFVGVSRIGDDPEGMLGLGIEFPDEDIRTLVSLAGLAR